MLEAKNSKKYQRNLSNLPHPIKQFYLPLKAFDENNANKIFQS